MTAETKVKLYTNHGCPWAHRAHIALAELGIPYDEEIIDLSVPRTPEYLAVNPRGLVPSLRYNDQVLTESAVVAQFLADAFPSRNLAPPSTSPEGALQRARVAFFADAWTSKVVPPYHRAVFAKTDADAEDAVEEAKAAIVKEIEPLLKDADPFFGGSKKMTLAEVLVAPFVLRLFTLSEHGVISPKTTEDLRERAPGFYRWAQEVIRQDSVTGVFDVEKNVERTRERLAKLRAQ